MPAQVVLVADVHGRVGLTTELRALLTELADASRSEPECVDFRVLGSEDPGEFAGRLLAEIRSQAPIAIAGRKRARRLEPNRSLCAICSAEGALNVPVLVGPDRKSMSTLPIRP